ncbi:unnamed protein product [Onchocerca flexuosa]|uniref:Protein kinase domain-containing protein n=1 Tax=Onchocerca flexuosa TaxID=387005 RepID=A0A183H342_9BILA|nr:unnamed protein product [Onchocerca flexuosa]
MTNKKKRELEYYNSCSTIAVHFFTGPHLCGEVKRAKVCLVARHSVSFSCYNFNVASMSPMSHSFKRLQQRLRRSLCYGSRRMKSLPFPLSELAMDYFDKHCPYDYISMDSFICSHGYVDACTFLVAMVYLDRMRTTDKTCFESSDPGQLYLSALIIASKYLHVNGFIHKSLFFFFISFGKKKTHLIFILILANYIKLTFLILIFVTGNLIILKFQSLIRTTRFLITHYLPLQRKNYRPFYTFNVQGSQIRNSKLSCHGIDLQKKHQS